MKTKLPLRFAAALAAVSLPLAAFAADPTPIRADVDAGLKHADRSFIEKSFKDGSDEIEISRIAAERTANPQVREFAQMMIADHEGANDSFTALATAKGVKLPAKEMKADNKWSKKDGKDFDQDYINKMVSDHEDAVKMFEKEAKDGSDPETVELARKTLPKLLSHLEHAKDLKKALK